MNQNPQIKKPWYKRPIALMAMAAIFLVGVYFLVTLLLLPPKRTKEQLYTMILTEENQKTIFANDRITEVKFEWVETSTSAGTDLTLTAIGGYQDGDHMVYVEETRVKLDKGTSTCSAGSYKTDSPLYMTRGDFKALHDLPGGTTDRVHPDDIKTAIRLVPYCTSDPGRENNVYCEASTANGSRPANPAPPFTSPCVDRCEE